MNSDFSKHSHLCRLIDYFLVAGLETLDTFTPLADNAELLDNYCSEMVLHPVCDLFFWDSKRHGSVQDGHRLGKTLGNLDGNVSSGTVFGGSQYLAFRRSAEEQSITNIVIVDETVTEEFQRAVYDEGIHWERIPGNLNKGLMGHTLTLYVEKDPLGDPIVDIIVVNASKSEELPRDYQVVTGGITDSEMNMNAGSSRHQMLLAYKTKGKQWDNEAVFYTAYCKQRFPETDVSKNPFNPDWAKFVFPRGLCVYPEHVDPALLLPRTRTFVLTNEYGVTTTATSLIFYEMRPTVSTDISHPKLTPFKYVHVPTALCILSQWAFYDNFKTFLSQLHSISCSPQNPIPLEKYLGTFLLQCPLPLRGHAGVQYTIGAKRCLFKLPSPCDLPSCGFSLQWLFRCLDIQNIIRIFGLFSCENRIIFSSKHLEVITPVAEGLNLLLFPFKYKLNFMPILPESMSFILAAPVPFLAGIHRDYCEGLTLDDDCYVVDLDRNTIKLVCEGGQTKIPIQSLQDYEGKIPDRLANPLQEKLLSLASGHYNGGALEDMNRLLEMDMNPEAADFDEREIRIAFLEFFVSIFKDYRRFLTPTPEKGQPLQLQFQTDDFIKSHPESYQSYISTFLGTQAWLMFQDERTRGEISAEYEPELSSHNMIFEWCISKTNERKGLDPKLLLGYWPKTAKEETPYEVPNPEEKVSDSDRAQAPFIYESWPELDLDIVSSCQPKSHPKNNRYMKSNDSPVDPKEKANTRAYYEFLAELSLTLTNYASQMDNSKSSSDFKKMVKFSLIPIYESWFRLFCRHCLERVSIASIKPRRDFVLMLTQVVTLLGKGHRPTTKMWESMAKFCSHNFMTRELMILDRMILAFASTNQIPPKYYEHLSEALGKLASVERLKFMRHYRNHDYVTFRSDMRFFDDRICYPNHESQNCEPDALIDYDDIGMPNIMTVNGHCKRCNNDLAGDEIMGGFVSHVFLNQNKKSNDKPSLRATNDSLVRCPFCGADVLPMLRTEMGKPLPEFVEFSENSIVFTPSTELQEHPLMSPLALRKKIIKMAAVDPKDMNGRLIQIVRSKPDIVWNLFFYFTLAELSTDFLIGGNYEFNAGANTIEYFTFLKPNERAHVLRHNFMPDKYLVDDLQTPDSLAGAIRPFIEDKNMFETLQAFLDGRDGDVGGTYRQIAKQWSDIHGTERSTFVKTFANKYHAAHTRLAAHNGKLMKDRGINHRDVPFISEICSIYVHTVKGKKNAATLQSQALLEDSFQGLNPNEYHSILSQKTHAHIMSQLEEGAITPRLRNILLEKDKFDAFKKYIVLDQKKRMKYVLFIECTLLLNSFPFEIADVPVLKSGARSFTYQEMTIHELMDHMYDTFVDPKGSCHMSFKDPKLLQDVKIWKQLNFFTDQKCGTLFQEGARVIVTSAGETFLANVVRTEIDNDALMVVVYVPELDVKHIVKAVDVIQPSMYDAMFRAVFRYLHQMIYPRFVSAAYHRSKKREKATSTKPKADTEKKMTQNPEVQPKT